MTGPQGNEPVDSHVNDLAGNGRVVAAHGRQCMVETAEGRRVLCHTRGKKSDCVVGDRVHWQIAGDAGVIDKVAERRNLLFRQDEWKTKSFAANLDQLLVLVAVEPMYAETQLARSNRRKLANEVRRRSEEYVD
jgi:ribosome biogenesis GTPase